MTYDFVDEYFDWMYDLVCNSKRFSRRSYRLLLGYLHHRVFTYMIDMDSNRAEDGIDLRDRFAYEYEQQYHCDRAMILECLGSSRCSVLEMLVALSIRCEEHIMEDSDIGDRTSEWFWGMLDNLGLGSMDDRRFNERRAREIIDIFLNREYEPDGRGGLFTIENCRYDLRTIDIWYQMNWYLNEIL